MSYDIIYELCTLHTTQDVIHEQERHFCQTYLGVEVTEYSLQQLHTLIFEHVGIRPRSADLFSLFVLIGPSNCFDTETNKRTRQWQFCSTDIKQKLFEQYACKWAIDVESGAIKPKGRTAKAESWIKQIRHSLDHAHEWVIPHSSIKVWVPVGSELNHFLQVVDGILKVHQREYRRFDESGVYLSLDEPSTFESWLFQQLIIKYCGPRWFDAGRPPYQLIKQGEI